MALADPPGVALTDSIPVLAPATVGLNVTWMVHVPFAAMAAVQPVAEKSPVAFTVGTPVVTAPELVTVNITGVALMALTATEPKSWVVGEILSAETPGPSIPPSLFGPSPLPPHPAAKSAPANPTAANRSKETRLPEQFIYLASIANQREHSPQRAHCSSGTIVWSRQIDARKKGKKLPGVALGRHFWTEVWERPTHARTSALAINRSWL
jgi:hypothetical protein